MKFHFLLLLLCCASVASAQTSQPSPKGKKLIEYGWDAPDTAFVRDHIREMEQHPFDGVVIEVRPRPIDGQRQHSLGRGCFSSTTFNASDYEFAIDDLRQTHFQIFTDNFIGVVCQPGDVDWFDPKWNAITNNLAVMAHIAYRGGCVGLMIDPEEYSHHLWTYAALPQKRRQKVSLAEYQAQARLRGREAMQAINVEFPNIHIFFLFGPTLTYNASRGGNTGYSLLAPFIEGMCLAADGGTQITDGYEQSYNYKFPTSFIEARKQILDARQTFQNQAAFDRVMRVGFGLWLDYDSGKWGWHPNDPSQNWFTPIEFQSAVYNALSQADEYVWIYSERFNWWTGKDLSPAYEAGQRAGRTTPVELPVEQHPQTPAQLKHLARAQNIKGSDDQTTFGDLMATHQLLLDFPSAGWRFRADPNRVGEQNKWFAIASSAEWTPIEIRKFWEEQGWDYDGFGWYRITFKIDRIPEEKKLSLVFGAVDENATAWLNGEKVGKHCIGEYGWDQRFSIDVTGKIKPGTNDLVVRALDLGGVGGTWKGIELLAEK